MEGRYNLYINRGTSKKIDFLNSSTESVTRPQLVQTFVFYSSNARRFNSSWKEVKEYSVSEESTKI